MCVKCFLYLMCIGGYVFLWEGYSYDETLSKGYAYYLLTRGLGIVNTWVVRYMPVELISSNCWNLAKGILRTKTDYDHIHIVSCAKWIGRITICVRKSSKLRLRVDFSKQEIST